jgi:NADH-quinone oxidoreductase subunit L
MNCSFLSPVLLSEKTPHIEHSTEYALMAGSVAIAAIAILFAINKYSKKPELNEPTGAGKVLPTNGILMNCTIQLL